MGSVGGGGGGGAASDAGRGGGGGGETSEMRGGGGGGAGGSGGAGISNWREGNVQKMKLKVGQPFSTKVGYGDSLETGEGLTETY